MAIRNLKTGEIVKVSRPLPLAEWPFETPPADTMLWRFGDFRFAQHLYSTVTSLGTRPASGLRSRVVEDDVIWTHPNSAEPCQRIQ